MFERQLFEIFKHMSATEYVSADHLAKAVGVSTKTVRTRLCALDEWLQKHQAALLSKPRYGYRILSEQYDALYDALLQKQEGVGRLPNSPQERVQYVLLYLTCQTDYIRSEDLAQFLYVSKGTLSGVLKQVEGILGNYRLRLDRRPNYGIKLMGREFDIRTCMLDYFVKRNLIGMDQKKQRADIEKIAALTETLLRKHEVHLSEIAHENIVLVLYITVERIKRGRPVEPLEVPEQADRAAAEFTLLEELMEAIGAEFSVSFAPEERDYLLLHLMSKQTTRTPALRPEEAGGENLVISEEISGLVDGMLQFIRSEMAFDFYSDFEVQLLLKQHMVKLDIRLRYHIFLENPLLEEIQAHHPIAYAIATLAASVLQEYYKTHIPEQEIAYLALLFQLGLERKQMKERRKLNILLVCVSGRSSSQLLKYKYIRRFHNYIQTVYTCDLMELRSFDLEKVHFVFTTVPIPFELSKPIVEVGLFLCENEIPGILRILEGQPFLWGDYFSEDWFFGSLQAESKEEALRALCARAKQREGIKSDLFASVLEREGYGSTDFGNLIAIPHPNQAMVEETKIYVAILDKPVSWERREVQVIFLALISGKTDPNLPKFYEKFLSFVMDMDKVAQLIETRRYETLMELLEQ